MRKPSEAKTPGHSMRSPRYACGACRDSGLVFAAGQVGEGVAVMQWRSFTPCTACDGKSRLAGEIDDTVATPNINLQRDLRHGGPS